MFEISDESLKELTTRLDQLKAEALSNHPSEESALELWIFLLVSISLSLLGWLLIGVGWSWWSMLGICALALGKFSRWIAAHHICHRGYDQARGLPQVLTSNQFGQQGLAWLLWVDWMPTPAWSYEHNVRHHSYTNVPHSDPDFVEEKSEWLRNLKAPYLFKLLIFMMGSMFWKPLYYGPNTILELNLHQKVKGTPHTIYSWAAWSPLKSHFWRVVFRSWLPYLTLHFIMPLMMIGCLWGGEVVEHALIYLFLAELLTNAYSFLMIVPNHAGNDLYYFNEKSTNRGEYFLRQIVSSCDYHTGHPIVDFLHGYLNYQIEHHLWPQLTMGQYRYLQPRVRDLCMELEIPYVQAPVWIRGRALVRLALGLDSAPLLKKS